MGRLIRRRLFAPLASLPNSLTGGSIVSHSLFDSLREFRMRSGETGRCCWLPALEEAGDGKKVAEEHVRQLANWVPNAARTDEIPSVPARVVPQDFTGVPLLCDLAAMRGVAKRVGRDPKVIKPLAPLNLVVDHSVQVDNYGTKDALDLNIRASFNPMASATVHEMGHAGVRYVQGRAARHRHGAPGEPRIRCPHRTQPRKMRLCSISTADPGRS
jgi:hypothetical protein